MKCLRRFKKLKNKSFKKLSLRKLWISKAEGKPIHRDYIEAIRYLLGTASKSLIKTLKTSMTFSESSRNPKNSPTTIRFLQLKSKLQKSLASVLWTSAQSSKKLIMPSVKESPTRKKRAEINMKLNRKYPSTTKSISLDLNQQLLIEIFLKSKDSKLFSILMKTMDFS